MISLDYPVRWFFGWVLCIIASATEHWRIWPVESQDGMYPGVVWIGICRACYLHSTYPENRYVHCEEFTEDLVMLPEEIILAQDLMTLSCIVGAVAVGFMSFALGIVVKTVSQKTFVLTLYIFGGLLNFLSGIMVLIPVSWNTYSILVNSAIMFPESVQMPTVPKHQEVGVAIYVGYSAAFSFLLSGIMIICNKILQKCAEKEVSPPADVSLTTTHFCTNFGSSVIINVQNREEPEPSDNELTSVHYVDIYKDSSQSIQLLLEDAKKSPYYMSYSIPVNTNC